MTADDERLTRLLDLVSREDQHLLAVRRRLLNDDCHITAGRVTAMLADDVGIDRLESFGAKFGRMQDTVIDKLLPTLPRAAGESAGAAIDNLSRLERIGLVESSDACRRCGVFGTGWFMSVWIVLRMGCGCAADGIPVAFNAE